MLYYSRPTKTYRFFQTLGLRILACLRFLTAMMGLLWFNAQLCVFGCGTLDPYSVV